MLPWPAVSVHAHLLNTGKVLFWQTGAQASLWDPATGSFQSVPNTTADLLCAGHAVLADGRVITLGGWDRSGVALGLNEVDVFEPGVRSWNRLKVMNFKRWYPTATRLPDGRVLAVSGARNSISDIVNTPEIYDPASDAWTSLTGAVRSIAMYPFMFVLPDGRIIHLGNSEVASRTETLNLATNTWTVIDSRLIDGGSAVTFGPGKFLKAGTAADSGNSGNAAATAFTLDMTQSLPTWQPTGSMAFPRSFLNLTTLPDGSVLATGGGTDRSSFITSNGILPAEIWQPSSGGWTTMASMVTPRLYHSTALLLPDARVLVAGGGSDSGVADQRTAEIFSPPYLFKGARPTITGLPSTVSYGTNFTVTTPDAADIGSVALVATGSVTHSFNQNQAFVNLPFSQTINGISIAAPANANLAPPGPYMLFIVGTNGVPSVASFVDLPLGPAPAPIPVPNVVGLTQAAAGSAIAAASLTVGTISNQASATVPAGSVISQNPAAGAQVSSGSAVALVVSSGPSPVVVPNVVNTTQAAATAAITAAGLVVGNVGTLSSATVPAGTVLSQSPAAATQVAPGSAVSLVVSSGPVPPAVVPNVVGLTEAAATTALAAAGLSLGEGSGTASSATVPAGAVISQSPTAGTQVPAGTVVTLVVSTGPAPAGVAVDTVVSVDGRDVVATPAFSTGVAGDLLVAFVSSDGPTVSAQQATVSGAGLAWTLRQRTNGQLGTSEIWTATASAVLNGVAVTSTQLSRGFDQSLTVVAFRGAAGVGAVGTANARTGAPAVVVTTTRPGSLVYAVGNDWDRADPRVVGTGQVMVHEWVDTGTGDTFWVQARSAPIAGAGAVSINDTLPNLDRWNLSAIEILAAGAAQIAVPNVVSLTQAAASSAITGAGLTVGTISSQASATVSAGAVISSSPSAGTQVTVGSAVNLVVSSGPPKVAVPTVIGLTQAAASSAITGSGLTVGTITTQSSTAVPAGSVISSSPSAGTQVNVGSAVALVVSSGPPQVAVPNVVGLSQAAASSAITGSGLTVGAIATQPSATVPAGSVISSSPAAGTQVNVGSTVDLVVSSGPAQVAVPLVVGLTQDAASSAITGAGLTVGAITNQSSATVPPGSVISSSPAAGAQVNVGSTVDLVVSSGPARAVIPPVAGLTQDAASSAITGAGLTVGAITNGTSATVPSGSVISSSPAAGTEVDVNTAVNLVVSSGPAQVAVPPIVGLAQDAASSAITAAGLTVSTTTTQWNATVPAGSVISSNPSAGTQVNLGSAVALVVSSGPPQVAVPNVAGLTQAAASAAITGAGLTVGAITNQTSAKVPSGSVMSSSPSAGTQVNVGSIVDLVVSSGPAQVGVPPVVGLAQDAASSAITGAGLTVGAITNQSSATVPAGSVISSSPAAGTEVDVNTAVNLVVSSGPAQVAVPPVVGLAQDAASSAITGAGLTVGATTNQSSATVPSGSVIGSNPSAGTQLNVGSAVNLIISSGPPQAAVPNVVGLTQAAASSAITGAGLTAGAITNQPSTTVPAGSVISSSPSAGTQVNVGSAVNMVVSSGPPQVAVPNVVGLTQSAASSAITGAGLTVGAITSQASATVPAGSVISQSAAAGVPVVVGSAVALVISSGPSSAPLAVDGVVFSDGPGARTTTPLSTAAPGDLLVAFVSAGGPTSLNAKQSVTVTGGGLTWTLVVRENDQFGTTEVWSAFAPLPLVNLTVTSTPLLTGWNQSLTVVAFNGAAGIGATGVAASPTGAAAVSLTTTKPGSFVYGVAYDSTRATARTLGPNQTMVHEFRSTTGANNYFWVQALANAVPDAGTRATLNIISPPVSRWNAAAVEIVPGGASASVQAAVPITAGFAVPASRVQPGSHR